MRWSPYIDGTKDGYWGFTGTRSTRWRTGMTSSRCTLAQALAVLDDGGAPRTSSPAVTKGRDFEFEGAVDDLRLNGRIADFEETGVIVDRALNRRS